MSRSFDDMFRPVYEAPATVAWGTSGLAMTALQAPMWPVLSIGALALGYHRAKQTIDLYRFRASLSALRVQQLPVDSVLETAREHWNDGEQGGLWLGNGFKWTQKHAEIARQIMARAPEDLPSPPAWLPQPLLKAIQPPGYVPLLDNALGVPWIHGVEPEEQEIRLPFDFLPGHTLIVGTTRAGKTKMYEVITTQVIHRKKNVLIVLDPKGDKDLENRMREECAASGRKFLYFHPAYPSKSIRINPVANWNMTADPATRIGQLIDAEGTFAAFAWKTLFRIMRAQVADGTMPNIKAAKEYVQQGVEPLLESLLQKILYAKDGAKWDGDLASFDVPVERGKVPVVKSERLRRMIRKYEMVIGAGTDEPIDSLIAMVNHSKEHYSKMIQVLEPILEMLGADEIGAMLSPDPFDLRDTRPIYDTNKIVEEGAVLYVGLDSLSNKIIASAIGSILLADFASVAGRIYNFSQKKDIYILIDEAAEVVNEQTIQILNKGGGAGIKAMLATQTLADFEAAFGSIAKTKQILGNLNNIICLRVKDTDTAEWIASSFGTTMARDISMSYATGSDSSKSMTEFRGSATRSLKETEIPFVSKDLLTRLPNFQYFAFFGGTILYKGRIPLLQKNKLH